MKTESTLPLSSFIEKIYRKFFSDYPGLTFDTDDYVATLIILALLGFALLLIVAVLYYWIHGAIDKRKGTTQSMTGIIVGRQYSPEQEYSGTTTTVMPTTGGGMGIGIGSVHSTSEEEFLIFVKADKIYKVLVDMQHYFDMKEGDSIRFSVTIGGLTGDILEIKHEIQNPL